MKDKVDVLFINPGNSRKIYQDLSVKFSAIEPPVFSGLFASFIRNKGYSTHIIDMPAEDHSSAEIATTGLELSPTLIVLPVYGFQPSASTQNMTSTGAICQEIKNQSPSAKILLTGTHPAALPERTLREESIDFVCTREGPFTILGLAQALEANDSDFSKVGDLCYWDNNHVRFTDNLPLIKDLDKEMPSIAWDLLPMERYRAHNWHCFDDIDKRTPYASIHTSIGCPYKCSFCCINAPFSGANYSIGGPSYRMWRPEQFVREVDYLVENFGIRNIKIPDEMFILNYPHVLGICDLLIERNYDLNIWAYGRIDTIKPEFLDKIRRAGFRWLGIGIESGSKFVRDGVEKKLRNEDFVDIIKQIQAADIYVGCNYIFGLPDDTQETMQETLDLAMEINSENANFYSAMAYPGSPLYNMAKEKGLPLPDDPDGPGWIGYAQHAYETLPLPTDTLSAVEVLTFRDQAFLKYFTNPSYLEMMRKRFGQKTIDHINEMTGYKKLKRKILGD